LKSNHITVQKQPLSEQPQEQMSVGEGFFFEDSDDGVWLPLLFRPLLSSARKKHSASHSFKLGGKLNVILSFMSVAERTALAKELVDYKYEVEPGSKLEPKLILRQYQVQNTNEPRYNGLFHKCSTTTNIDIEDEDEEQPGYTYGAVSMKARSIEDDRLIEFQKLFDQMEDVWCGISGKRKNDNDEGGVYNCGAHVVMYRDGRDSMGRHSDNAQKEKFIATLVVQQNMSRCVLFEPTSGEGKRYKLVLQEGDLYTMDGMLVA
jgi:hypothetical protein